MEGINVLSLFDGMSCGQIALKEMGIKVNKYYAAEIDKHAIKNSSHNFPDMVHLGDVTKVKALDLPVIHLIIGGSPCQGFSFAGKQLNFDDPRSALFFEFKRLVDEVLSINPSAIFLLENVNMKKQYRDVITKALFNIPPIFINSELLSAQSRPRWYWTNAKTKNEGLFNFTVLDINKPKDKGILLRDVLQDENEIDSKYYIKVETIKSLIQIEDKNAKIIPIIENIEAQPLYRGVLKYGRTDEAKKIRSDNMKRGIDYTPFAKKEVVGFDSHKMNTITTQTTKDNIVVCIASRGRGESNNQVAEPRYDGKTICLTSVQKDNYILYIKDGTEKGYSKISPGECFDSENQGSKTRRGRRMQKKANCLVTQNSHIKYTKELRLRRLTVLECCRLQTVPEWYKWEVSDNQAYKMLGNGWTVDVIVYLFSHIDFEKLINETNN